METHPGHMSNSKQPELVDRSKTTMQAGLSRHLLGIVVSGVMLYGYARGYYALGFIALVPWLCALERCNRTCAVLSGLLMSMIFTLAVFSWFGAAIAAYTGLGVYASVLLICLLAPVWQAPIWLFALTRSLATGALSWRGIWLATAAWVICEWLWPKVLGDTLGHGLAPSLWLRQGADLAGTAGLTAVLLLTNSAFALAWTRRRESIKCWLQPLCVALVLPAALAAYGAIRLASLEAYYRDAAPSMRVGMVQTSLVDYESRRHQLGSYAVVREILDRHFALSQAAITHHGAEALVWSETVYPSPFGFPRSADAAAFDHELKSFIDALGVPLIFGSYELDALGEYNAAVLLDQRRELTTRYRKTRLFPFTERIPPWLDFAWVRAALPWTGRWLPGNGVRVLPLSTPDGRELNVVPLICLDDVDPQLAVDGARLGAQAIVGLSNDSWFSQYPQGLELHLAVARFRSIETRLPQLRATTNGYTAFIDPSGEVLARTVVGDQAVLAGEVPIRNPPPTLVTRWGRWLEPVALAGLALYVIVVWHARRRSKMRRQAENASTLQASVSGHLVLVSNRAYTIIALLTWLSWLGLIVLASSVMIAGWRVHTLNQLYGYLAFVAFPWLLAWQVRRRHRVNAQTVTAVAAQDSPCQLRYLPIPALRGIAPTVASATNLLLDTSAAHRLVQHWRQAPDASPTWLKLHGSRLQAHTWPDQFGIKFVLFPLLMALPAFRLHQVISYGGTFGEYYSFGAWAYLQGLMIWWASWSLGLVLWATGLRLLMELVMWLSLQFGRACPRAIVEFGGRLMFYLAVPLWFSWRVTGF